MAKLKASFLLLVLLLLPVRSAMAAVGILCHLGPERVGVVEQHHVHQNGEDAGHHAVHGAADAGLNLQLDQQHSDGGPLCDVCNLCSSVCSTPPLATPAAYVAVPHAAGSLAFPPVSATHVSHVTDGLERPPRAI